MLHGQARPAILLTIVLCLLTGVLYPGVVTGLARLLFPWQANGSQIRAADGHLIGSALIGQSFTRPEYFHGRPSAAGNGYDASASSGTNRGPTDLKLADTLVAGAVDDAIRNDGAVKGHVPADMATSSASGLDPHISPANAQLQVARVARARAADPRAIRALVDAHMEGRALGFLGEPRVNVLLLNLALDERFPRRASAPGAGTAR